MRADLSDRVLAIGGTLLRGAVYLMLALPAVIVVAASFTEGASLRFPPQGFSLQWYVRAWNSVPFMDALWTSTRLAIVATLLSLCIGVPAALAIDRHRFRGRSAFQSLVLSPLV